MLINLDAKALEWVCAVYLSGDEVGIRELNEGLDIHASNQSAFGLPSRLVAKTFVFRILYGGSAYAFSVDPNFAHVSGSERWWQARIDAFYSKYKGIAKWHENLVKEVGNRGILTMPTGRSYVFLTKKDKKGNTVLPRTQILNYPVQGLGADLMAIVRASLRSRLHKQNVTGLMVCTVHDSVLIDCPRNEFDKIVKIIYSVFEDLPRNFEKLFGVPFFLKLGVEVQAGDTWGDMVEVDKSLIMEN